MECSLVLSLSSLPLGFCICIPRSYHDLCNCHHAVRFTSSCIGECIKAIIRCTSRAWEFDIFRSRLVQPVERTLQIPHAAKMHQDVNCYI